MRISVTLTDETDRGLREVAKIIGSSRSALIASILEPSVKMMTSHLGSLGLETPTPDKILYARGESVDLIEDKLRILTQQLEDTVNGKFDPK
jgi:hypothetical protein